MSNSCWTRQKLCMCEKEGSENLSSLVNSLGFSSVAWNWTLRAWNKRSFLSGSLMRKWSGRIYWQSGYWIRKKLKIFYSEMTKLGHFLLKIEWKWRKKVLFGFKFVRKWKIFGHYFEIRNIEDEIRENLKKTLIWVIFSNAFAGLICCKY